MLTLPPTDPRQRRRRTAVARCKARKAEFLRRANACLLLAEQAKLLGLTVPAAELLKHAEAYRADAGVTR
ncbi:MAG: hypothetical protein KDB70_14035 [Mycobacterium sp.]|jgi:hypothetical protein|nr:hypothetical protein [Mycobacterium sp.]